MFIISMFIFVTLWIVVGLRLLYVTYKVVKSQNTEDVAGAIAKLRLFTGISLILTITVLINVSILRHVALP